MYDTLTLDAYARLSARSLAVEVAAGRLSPVNLVECALELARRAEPTINAYVCLLEDQAKADAATREREVRSGRLRGRLHGVPIAVKDNFYVKGLPVTKGSRTTDGSPAGFDSPMVERIVTAGAIIVGKTTMPEFGWKGTGISPLTGITRNPWNPQRNSGGSSAGSAATVAAGAVPIALGSDAGGSIRIPASFCGAVGLKPTLSRIPVFPGTVTETLSHVGPICRTVDDARLVLELTGGPDPRDPLSYGALCGASVDRHERLREGRARIGIVRVPFGYAPDDCVSEVFSDAVSRIRSLVAANFVECPLDIPLPRSVFDTLWVSGRGLGFQRQFEAHATSMDPGLVRLGPLAQACSLAQYFTALEGRRAFNSAVFAAFGTFDLLVMPTMPLVAFAADAEVPPGGDAGAPLPWTTWTPYTYPFNLSGQPAISIPCGLSPDGLPIGLQVLGPWGCDELVLDLAQLLENVLEYERRAGPSPCLRNALTALQ